MSEPKIGVLDIETSAMEALVWERKDVNIGVDMITKDWEIIAWSFKWLGEKKVHYYDTRSADEFLILSILRDFLDKADIIITQNGQSFDSRKINARLIHYGIPPPSPYRHLDTYRIARKVGAFTSYSLDYLAQYFNTKHQKLKHSKFPGISLWKECAKENIKAWDEMRRYNINDTLTTEDVYMALRAWVPESLPDAHTRYDPELCCRVCGVKTKMWHKGYEIRNTGRYHRYQCQSCYAWTKGSKKC